MPDWIKNLIYKTASQDQYAIQIAKHLSKVLMYEWKGLDALYPDFKDKVVRLIARMEELKMPVVVSEGFRTPKQQDIYYAQGRTTAGKIVTNVRALQSYHQYGLAVDLIFKDYQWSPPAGWFETLGAEGQKLGLIWGGSWPDFKDRPHFEWHPGFTWSDLESYFK